MNYRMIGYLLGIILLIEAALLCFPMIAALAFAESALPFLYTIGILAAVGLGGLLCKPKDTRIYAKEGFVCVAAAWILMSAFGALPFVFSGAIPNYVDALFETASGFTTTGASILTEVESLPKGILFWRSFTHWIGGMGVLMFMLAILPSDDGRAIHLMRAEVPGPTKGKLVPKMRKTALILYAIYLFLTVAHTVALCIAGFPFYDAIVTAFGTTGTGGFSVKNASIAGYANPAAEWIIATFMLLCGINFNLYYFLLIKRFRDVFRSEELHTYLLLTFGATVAIVLNTWNACRAMFDNFGDCLRAAFFQVTTVMSTAGYGTVDFDLWPEFSKTILVLLMFCGACAGSTAGGLKISRVLILWKSIVRNVKKVLRPKSVNVVRLDGEPVADDTIHNATSYLALYLLVMLVSFLLISVDDLSMTANITATVSCLNNVGPGLAEVGPTGNYAAYSIFSKIVLTLDMLFGRLEIIPMLILLAPSTWKKKG